MNRRTRLVLLLATLPAIAGAQPAARPEILVLGTFHMANPGRDLHNLEVDDVLSPVRQAEFAQLLAVLKRFRPTKIAVEADVNSKRVATQYAEYRAGTHALSTNETEQIGFRLAKDLGQATIHAVDEGGDFPFYRVRNFAIANGLKDQFEAAAARTASRVAAENAFLRTHSILGMLEMMNADTTVATAVGEYYTSFMPFGQPYEYAGPDLIASWFQRNLRIYHNIRALITSPEERVLVIYGAGHLGWLRQITASDPAVRLRTLHDLIAAG